MRLARLTCGFVLCLALIPMRAHAEPNYSRIALINASAGLGGGQPILFGIRIEPRAGWKTYWRAPGENGLPPVFEFIVHDNAAKPVIKWPAPRRILVQGRESYGYDGPVIFPFFVLPQNAALPVSLVVRVDYAVCMDICVPEQAELKIMLPPGPAHATAENAALQAALSRVPVLEGADSFARITGVALAQNRGRASLRVEASARHGFVRPDLFADGQEDLLFEPPEIIYRDERKSATFKVPVVLLDRGRQIAGRTITLTLVDGEISMEKQVKLAQQSRTE